MAKINPMEARIQELNNEINVANIKLAILKRRNRDKEKDQEIEKMNDNISNYERELQAIKQALAFQAKPDAPNEVRFKDDLPPVPELTEDQKKVKFEDIPLPPSPNLEPSTESQPQEIAPAGKKVKKVQFNEEMNKIHEFVDPKPSQEQINALNTLLETLSDKNKIQNNFKNSRKTVNNNLTYGFKKLTELSPWGKYKNKRTEQITNLLTCANHLKTATYTPHEKAQLLYAKLNDIVNEIKKEKHPFSFSSGMEKMCRKYQKNITDNGFNIDNLKMSYSDVLKNITEKAVDENMKLESRRPSNN